MNATFVYLVRHGQTAWNREGTFRGRKDVPLDDTGRRQAALAAEYFKGMEIDAVYSSPLSRAMETAREIARPQEIEVKPLSGIIDMSFGQWEGRPVREVRETDGPRYRQWVEVPHLLEIPGGETLDGVMARSMAALEEVIRSHSGKTVILVSHRVVNRMILCGILGLDSSHFWQMVQGPTAINLIQYGDGRYILSLLNDVCHLKAVDRKNAIND